MSVPGTLHSVLVAIGNVTSFPLNLYINGEQSPIVDVQSGIGMTPFNTAPSRDTSIVSTGTGSVHFNGGYLSIPGNYYLGNGDWTIEFNFYTSSFAGNQVIIARDKYGVNLDWVVEINSATAISVVTGNRSDTVTATVPTMSINTWYKVAVVRYNGLYTIYLNDVPRGAGVIGFQEHYTNPILIGCSQQGRSPFNGYLDEFRITAGTAVYTAVYVASPVANFSATTLTGYAPLAVTFTDTTANAPTSWSWNFGDGNTSTAQSPTHTFNATGAYTVTLTATNAGGSSVHSVTVTANLAADPNFSGVSLLVNGDSGTVSDVIGNVFTTLGLAANVPVISNSVYKYGSGSVYFNGAGALRAPYSAAFNLNSVDSTIEAWFNPSQVAANAAIISKDTYGSNFDWCILFPAGGRSIELASSGTSVTLIVTIPQLVVGTWYHVAIVRSGTTITIYLNGVAYGSKVMNYSNSDVSYLTVGCESWNNPNSYFKGYIDDLRVTKGTARYTANFTPPGQAAAY